MNTNTPVLNNIGSKMKWMGWLCVVFGVLAIAAPWVAGKAVLFMIGALVSGAGIMRMIWAFQAGSLGNGILVFVIGFLTVIAGIVLFANPLLSSALLSLLLGAYFVADGVAELLAALSLCEGKGWVIFDGIVTLLLGVFIFIGFPLSGILAIGVFLGIKLLLVGITMLTLRSAVRNAL